MLALIQDSVDLVKYRVLEATPHEPDPARISLALDVSVYCIRQLPLSKFMDALMRVMYVYGTSILGLRRTSFPDISKVPDSPDEAEDRLISLLSTVNKMTVIEPEVQRAWAHALLHLIREYVVQKIDFDAMEPPTAQNLVAHVRHEFEPMVYRVTATYLRINTDSPIYDWSAKALQILSMIRSRRLCEMIAVDPDPELLEEAWTSDAIQDLKVSAI